MSDCLWPNGLQHARLPCPSPMPGAYSNTCPLSQWCHPTISSSVVPLSSFLQSIPASESFPMSQFFASGGQSIGISSRGVGQWWPAAGSGLLSVAVYAWDLLKEVPLSSLPPPEFGLRSNNREGTQPHPSTENWIKDLLSTALPIRTKPSFPFSQSLPSESFYKPLILNRSKITGTEN